MQSRICFLTLLILLVGFMGCETVPEHTPLKIFHDYGVMDTPWGKYQVQTIKALKTAMPEYPHELRRTGITGEVTLLILVDETGEPESMVVSKSSGHEEFDQNAVQCITHWRYPVRLQDGEPVKYVVLQTIKFSLSNGW